MFKKIVVEITADSVITRIFRENDSIFDECSSKRIETSSSFLTLGQTMARVSVLNKELRCSDADIIEMTDSLEELQSSAVSVAQSLA